MPQVRYPSLYQVNTRVRLRELGAELGRPATLGDVPEPQGLIQRCREGVAAIGAECAVPYHAGMADELAQFLAAGHVPQAQRFVPRGGEGIAAIRAEREGVNVRSVPAQHHFGRDWVG